MGPQPGTPVALPTYRTTNHLHLPRTVLTEVSARSFLFLVSYTISGELSCIVRPLLNRSATSACPVQHSLTISAASRPATDDFL